MASEPISGAIVQVWALDRGGRQMDEIAWTVSAGPDADQPGRFLFDLDLDDFPVLVTVRSGTTSEYWAPGVYSLDGADDTSHHYYEAVLSRFHGGEPARPFVVSPLTTLARVLADERHALGLDARWIDSLIRARALVGEHFDIDLTMTRPELRAGASMTADARHGLALMGLSDLARDMVERSGSASVLSMNTGIITKMLMEDARGPGAVLDGIGPDGAPVVFDNCSPACILSGDTLRGELGRTLSAGYLRSPQNNTGLDYSDASEWIRKLLANMTSELFVGASMAALDEGAPMIELRPSPVFDEQFDIITFDMNAAPIHQHSAVTVDLADGFAGAGCPVVHKHVNTMWDSADNPIRMRFVVRDDVVGVSEKTIHVAVQAEGTPESFAVPARAVGWGAGGVMEYQATITRAEVPALADREGRFFIEVEAADWVGNEAAPVRGCWEHRPLPAQPWVSQARVAGGPDALQSVGLEPDNNLAPLLSGTDPGKGVMEFDIRNGTDDVIYVTLDYSQPVARYFKSWIETNAELYEINVPDDTCLLSPVTCPENLPPDAGTYIYPDVEGVIGDLISGVRVWDVTTAIPYELFRCTGCDIDEFRLEPRRGPGEPRMLRVQLVTDALPELAPRTDAEPPDNYHDTPIHVIHEPTEITGSLLGTLRRCLETMGSQCIRQAVYRRYRALTEATLVIDSLVASGSARARIGLSRHVPAGQPNTLGVPVGLDSVQWSSMERPLPPPPEP